eukprot:jgi/Mesen1/811/ME000110S_11080
MQPGYSFQQREDIGASFPSLTDDEWDFYLDGSVQAVTCFIVTGAYLSAEMARTVIYQWVRKHAGSRVILSLADRRCKAALEPKGQPWAPVREHADSRVVLSFTEAR